MLRKRSHYECDTSSNGKTFVIENIICIALSIFLIVASVMQWLIVFKTRDYDQKNTLIPKHKKIDRK